MKNKIERRFIFRGNASGVAAHIRRPGDEVIPVQAASSLPVIGGISESEANGRESAYVRFERAKTSARGDFDDRDKAVEITNHKCRPDSVPTTTTVTAEVTGLAFRDRVSVGRAAATFVSRSPKRRGQPSIVPEGTAIEKLVIDNCELIVTLSEDLFRRCNTKAKLNKAGKAGAPHGVVDSEGVTYATLVVATKWADRKPEGVDIDGNVIAISDFGRLYLAELLITDVSRRLTMVRAELGSPVGGSASASEIETNGIYWPA